MKAPTWVRKIRAIAFAEATTSFFECRCSYLGDFGDGPRYEHVILLDISGKRSGHSEQLIITMVDKRQLNNDEVAQWLKEQVYARSLSWHPRDFIETNYLYIAVFILGIIVGSWT